MYISTGANEYHHITINDIIDYRHKDEPFLIIKGKSKLLQRNTKSPSGFKIIPYSISIRVRGFLMDYVTNELKIEDNIFVVGRTDMMYSSNISKRELVAECIYREDWMTYYRAGNINPKDVEDYI